MRRIIAALVLAVALAIPSIALASGGSSCQTYNPQTCSAVGASGTGPTDAQTLPFTGINVPLMFVCGAGLLAGGVAVRRLSRASS